MKKDCTTCKYWIPCDNCDAPEEEDVLCCRAKDFKAKERVINYE